MAKATRSKKAVPKKPVVDENAPVVHDEGDQAWMHEEGGPKHTDYVPYDPSDDAEEE